MSKNSSTVELKKKPVQLLNLYSSHEANSHLLICYSYISFLHKLTQNQKQNSNIVEKLCITTSHMHFLTPQFLFSTEKRADTPVDHTSSEGILIFAVPISASTRG